jgi:hypothetical protein
VSRLIRRVVHCALESQMGVSGNRAAHQPRRNYEFKSGDIGGPGSPLCSPAFVLP